MRSILLAGASALLFACSSDARELTSSRSAAVTTPGATPPSATAPEAASACPASVPAAKQLVKDTAATSVQVVGDQVYYQSTSGLMKVGLDGTGPVQVFSSAALVHAWVQDENVLTVETTDGEDPTAVIRLIPLADAPNAQPGDGTTIDAPDTLNSASTRPVAADKNGFIVLGETADKGAAIYRVGTDSTMTALVPADGSVLTNLQLTPSALWFVKDGTHVNKIDLAASGPDGLDLADLTGEAATAKEAFTVDAKGCNLVITGEKALCVQTALIDERDLTGANVTPVLDLTKSAIKDPFGVGVAAGDGLVVASSGAIRAVKSGSEGILACGRTNVDSFDVGASTVVWADAQGVWSAAR